jgi:hypothetical protein
MHDSAPIPPDPESERRGHELRDVAIKPILIFLILLFVFGGVLQSVMSLIMNGVIIPESHVGAPAVDVETTRKIDAEILDNRFRDTGSTVKSAEHLQRNTTKDMLAMYKEDDAVLTSFGIDKKTQKVHIPITRAMKILVEKKLLKSREGVSKATLDPTLPYPVHSEPYKAKY